MFRNALAEIRQHPGRMVATLIAIAISVAFMAGTSIYLATEKNGLGGQLNRQVTASDVVISYVPPPEAEGTDPAAPAKALATTVAGVKGVKAAEPVSSTGGTLDNGETVAYLQLLVLTGPDFRWAKIDEGRWPQSATELALPHDIARKLGLSVGGTVTFNGQQKLTLVGITDDPKSLLMPLGYLAPAAATALNAYPSMVLVKTDPGSSADQVAERVKAAVPSEVRDHVVTKQAYMDDQLTQLTQGVDAIRTFLMVFAGIALVVGMIIISNTFTILITQRRRQIGLLRAVGASTGQVRRQLLAEALVTGLVGSVVGVAAGAGLAAAGAAFTGSLYWGLRFPPVELLIEVGVGVLITVLAALVPVWKTSRVKPLEALQPVLTADAVKKVSIVRAVICGVLLLIGIGFMALSLSQGVNTDTDTTQAITTVAYAVAAAAFIAVAVLAAAPLYVSWLIRGLGKLTGLTGPTARMATMNASRNPNRAAATAVALMLAMGLIVTLQVATASVRTTAINQIDQRYPVDLQVSATSPEGLSTEVQDKLGALPGVSHAAVLKGGPIATQNGNMFMVVGANSDAGQVASTLPASIPAGTALVDNSTLAQVKDEFGGDTGTFTVGGRTVTLKVQKNNAAGPMMLVVSESTLTQLMPNAKPMTTWIKLVDRDNFARTMLQLQTLPQSEGQYLSLSGGAMEAYVINRVLNVLLTIATALLGVAVLIALVGVANTLGLSVIERTRESALLRALGMHKAKLRLMLWLEAVALALVGVVVGILAGSFFAWLGVGSIFRAAGVDAGRLDFAIDPWQTLALIAIAVVAASLASILPGRRAANAAPTQALAAD
ncbi:ABC transporter permease [Aestuariimicrobium kwangyangense]|uniref:ABC transporter permease n=1 Tax=Aestuariimicrobium kwangyangense TaxID=396389 RepID=UPI0003B390DC|nr:ABC transporter permease [Aestuariimicrobium kwangyangense]